VDDGSTDASRKIIESLCSQDPLVKGIFFRRNFGQTAAMAAGIDHARGDIIVLMDADRQNDPADIPKLLKEIEEGHDVVVGWRKDRQDNTMSRKLPSYIANYLIRKIGGVKVHDLGCSLKAFRSQLIKEVKLYGEMHRFIPLYTTAHGGRLIEVVVNHRPRVAGKTKYGVMRTFKVILDLITVKFLMSYSTRPMYFFGSIGLSLFGLALLSSLFLLIHKFVNGISIIQSPLLILSAVLAILACNFILMGLLAEIMMRIYYDSSNRPSYYLQGTRNI
jgi:glycosyltransferase involved in cell wall biosynthesis